MKSAAIRAFVVVFSVLTGAFLFQNCSSSSSTPAGQPASPSGNSTSTSYPSRLHFTSIPATHGIFDVSLAQDPSTNIIWMAYSAVNASVLWPTQNVDVVTTGLASSTDQGATWTDFGSVVNPALDVTIALAAPLNAGTWHNEVSSLVFDAAAPANQRWKLMWHHYLLINQGRRFEHGWIGLKMAATPQQLASATEIKLFTGSLYDVSNNTAGGGSKSPLGGAPAIALDVAVDSHLNGCAVFTEPGMMAASSGLYVTLLCGVSPTQHRIVILKCANPCNAGLAASWSYLGDALTDADAANLGFNQGYSGASLVSSNGSLYLLATPVSSTPYDGFYNGCYLYKFSDITTASLVRSAGVPTPVLTVKGAAGSFNGACSFLPGATKTGVIYDQVDLSVTDKFQLFSSGVTF